MHAASSLDVEEEAAAWHGEMYPLTMAEPSGQLFPLRPLGDDEMPAEPIERVIQRRGSTRQFVHSPITFGQLSTVLHRATQGVPADFLGPEGTTLNDLYLIVNAVEELPSGAYVFRRDLGALGVAQER